MKNISLRIIFGKNVKKYRQSLGLSQEKFAELSNLHRTYVSDIECFRRNVSLDIIEKISVALKVDAYVLLMDENINS